jgi:HSP20 family molecular chaperone IbpA
METTKFRSLFPSITTSGPLDESLLDHIFSDMITPSEYVHKRHKIKSGKDESIIEIPLPGACKDDVSISIKDSDKLIIEVAQETKWSGGQIYKFRLLPDSDKESITAQMENGLLILTVSKKKSFQDKIIKIK